jgi:hypothetical protein
MPHGCCQVIELSTQNTTLRAHDATMQTGGSAIVDEIYEMPVPQKEVPAPVDFTCATCKALKIPHDLGKPTVKVLHQLAHAIGAETRTKAPTHTPSPPAYKFPVEP